LEGPLETRTPRAGFWSRALVVLAHGPAIGILLYLLIPIPSDLSAAPVIVVPLAAVAGGVVAWRRGLAFVCITIDAAVATLIAVIILVASTFRESNLSDRGVAWVAAAFVTSLVVGAGAASVVDGRTGAIRSGAGPRFAAALAIAGLWITFTAVEFPR
jgi:hypothetical protein